MAYEGFTTPSIGGFGTTGCTPISAPAGTTFRCRFFGLPPGATPVTTSTTNPNGNPVTDTFDEPIAADGSTTLYTTLTTQGNRTITVTAGGVSASSAVIVGPPNFSLSVTQARNGFVSLQTRASIPCAMYLIQPDGRVTTVFDSLMTGTSDATGLLSFTYQTLTTPAGTWRYSIRCTSGSETLFATPTFAVP